MHVKNKGENTTANFFAQRDSMHSLFYKLTRQFLCCKKSTATFHCHFYLQSKVLETCMHLTIISAVTKLGMDWIFQLLSQWLWLPLSFVKSRVVTTNSTQSMARVTNDITKKNRHPLRNPKWSIKNPITVGPTKVPM